jgi:small GTP-binding protein
MRVKLCLVGDFQVGKTSLIRRFVLDEFDDHHLETIGTKVSKKTINVDNPTEEGLLRVRLMVWDVMGRKEYGDLLREAYFYGAKGIVAVCDLTRPETVESLREWIGSVRHVTGGVPVHILANKADLEAAVDEKAIADLAAEYESPYHLTSAKTGKNVEVCFADIALRTSALYYGVEDVETQEPATATAD